MSNNFKEYENKSSVKKRYSRYTQGGDTDVFKKRLGWWEKRDDIATNQIDDVEFEVTSEYVGRPDKIAVEMYGRHDLTWIVLQYNNIVDINEEMTIGTILNLPSKQRVLYTIAIKQRVFNEDV